MVDVIVTTAGGVEEDYIKVRQGAGQAGQARCQATGRPSAQQRARRRGGVGASLCAALPGVPPSPCVPTRCAATAGARPACPAPQCMAPTYLGDFQLKGADLRRRGLNRIGNMLVPNSNYCKFEDWVSRGLLCSWCALRWGPARCLAWRSQHFCQQPRHCCGASGWLAALCVLRLQQRPLPGTAARQGPNRGLPACRSSPSLTRCCASSRSRACTGRPAG